jgi:hypothetical protein
MSARSTSFLPVSTTIRVNKEEKLVFHKTGKEKLEFDEQTCKNERVKEGKIVCLLRWSCIYVFEGNGCQRRIGGQKNKHSKENGPPRPDKQLFTGSSGAHNSVWCVHHK